MPDMHQRLEEMRAQIYRRRNAAPHADKTTFPDKISLCEGGCLLRPHPRFFESILETFGDYLHQPLQIYPQNNVIPALLDRLKSYHATTCGLPPSLAANILLAVGSSQVLEAMLAVIKKPDGIVLMPTSCYHAFVDWPVKWGMQSHCVPTTEATQFKLLGAHLAAWLDANPRLAQRTTMLLLANPTTAGAVYTPAELAELAAVIKARQIPVFMDEVYRGTEFTDQPTASLAACPGMEEWVVTANSPSKAWQCANLRIGWAAVPSRWLSLMQKIINNSITELPFLLQGGLLGALQTPQDYLDIFRTELATRANLCLTLAARLNADLNKRHHTTGVNYIHSPYHPQAGHFVVLNLNAFHNALTPQGTTLQTPLQLGAYLHEFEENGAPAGVTLSSGYSKGHEDSIFYLSFAQLGFEEISAASQQTELATMVNHLTRQIQGASLAQLPVPATDFTPGLTRGRAVLEEAFRRMGLALAALQLAKQP